MKLRYLSITFALGVTLTLLWLLSESIMPVIPGTGMLLSNAEGLPRPDGDPMSQVLTVCLSGGCDYTGIQDAVDAANDGDVIKVAAGTYTGVRFRPRNDITTTGVVVQVVYISKTITIRGGYSTAFTEPPNPEANPTILDAQGQGRGLYITGNPAASLGQTISPIVEGLHVTGGEAAGQGGHLSDWGTTYDAGGGVYIINATTTISNSRLSGNAAQYGGGVYLYRSGATLSNNAINDNTARRDGGGLYLYESPAILNSNTVAGNGTDGDYHGGGLYLFRSDATIIGNTIFYNHSDYGGGLYLFHSNATLNDNAITDNRTEGVYGASGGGLYLSSSAATLIGNTISDNTTSGFKSGGNGGGLTLISSDATLVGNTISSNSAYGCGGYLDNDNGGDGGGLYLYSSNATLTGNTVISNAATGPPGANGGGLYLSSSAAILNGSTITANTANGLGGGLHLASSSNATIDGNIIAANTADRNGGGICLWHSGATLVNNVVTDNWADVAGSGLYIRSSSPRLMHTTIARNAGGDGDGIFVNGWEGQETYYASSVALTNTILISHTVGISVTAGNTATLEATLWGSGVWANRTDWERTGTIITGTPAYNYWGDPAFVNPDAGNYHISTGSAAIDTGVDAGVSDDIDGDPRTDGHPDLGVDELIKSLMVTKLAYPNPVQPGAQLTYIIYVTNTGDMDLNATITDTLPAHVTLDRTSGGTLVLPGAMMGITWTAVVTAPGSGWAETIVVTVMEDHNGPLTNLVEVTTEEGATGSAWVIVNPYNAYLPVIFRQHQ